MDSVPLRDRLKRSEALHCALPFLRSFKGQSISKTGYDWSSPRPNKRQTNCGSVPVRRSKNYHQRVLRLDSLIKITRSITAPSHQPPTPTAPPRRKCARRRETTRKHAGGMMPAVVQPTITTPARAAQRRPMAAVGSRARRAAPRALASPRDGQVCSCSKAQRLHVHSTAQRSTGVLP